MPGHLASIRQSESPTPLHRIPEMQEFVFQHSPIQKMKLCSPFTPCRRRLCPWCARRARRKAVRDLRPLISDEAPALYARPSVAATHDLDAAWSALLATRERFARMGVSGHRPAWLSARSTSWLRTTEATHGPEGWNLHDNLLIFGTPDQLAHLQETIVYRWTEAADRPGTHALPAAQYAQRARRPRAVLKYIYKGLCAYAADASRGRTPGNLLHDWHAGDDLAGELWKDMARYLDTHRTIRLSQRGGALRGVKQDAAPLRRGSFDLAA